MAHFLWTKILYCSCLPLGIVLMRLDDEYKCLFGLFLDLAIRVQCETQPNDYVPTSIVNLSQLTDTYKVIRRLNFF